ncbi:MAG: carboxypeptidase-like regulatory domain-containing protein [Blastocatellia bacterium]|nr:carboxypeptidase-like regulatory domain-containing protein [Blastocatellia bacterium]
MSIYLRMVFIALCAVSMNLFAFTASIFPYITKNPAENRIATITGTIHFVGTPPEPKHIRMESDPNCPKDSPLNVKEDSVVTDGKLANVFVYLDGNELDNQFFPEPPPEVVLTYIGCRIIPRVMGIQTQQMLDLLNSDVTTHNVHPQPRHNKEWNLVIEPGALLQKQFDKPETMIKIRCNQHPWEEAYVGVMKHPFFAVSGLNGSYTISNVPPGNYFLVAWHEKYGEQKAEVKIGLESEKTIDFTFTSEQ